MVGSGPKADEDSSGDCFHFKLNVGLKDTHFIFLRPPTIFFSAHSKLNSLLGRRRLEQTEKSRRKNMRQLTEEETKTLFLKLTEYIGKNVEKLVNRTDERHCFRIHNTRVYYVSESILQFSNSVSKDSILHIGSCLGKFTNKSGKFRLHITALDYLSQYCVYKVWIKPSAEMSFLYGNHVTKSGLARMTEGTPQYAGVVVYNVNDIPLGFGVAAQSTDVAQSLDPTGIVVLHQADIGDYLRGLEDEIF